MENPQAVNPVFALTLTIVSLVAFAEASDLTPAKASRPAWSSIDLDRDGVVSAAELAPYPSLRSSLVAIDADNDGGISKAEYATWLAAPTGAR